MSSFIERVVDRFTPTQKTLGSLAIIVVATSLSACIPENESASNPDDPAKQLGRSPTRDLALIIDAHEHFAVGVSRGMTFSGQDVPKETLAKVSSIESGHRHGKITDAKELALIDVRTLGVNVGMSGTYDVAEFAAYVDTVHSMGGRMEAVMETITADVKFLAPEVNSDYFVNAVANTAILKEFKGISGSYVNDVMDLSITYAVDGLNLPESKFTELRTAFSTGVTQLQGITSLGGEPRSSRMSWMRLRLCATTIP